LTTGVKHGLKVTEFMKELIKVAIIGCGRVAQHYKRVLDSGAVSGWRIVGCCDPIISRADDLASHFDARAYNDYQELLKVETPDLIIILTPSGQHYAHSKLAIECGFNVLVEKPCVLIPEQAAELVSLAQEKKIMYGTVFQNRLNPAIVCLRRALMQQRFGRIVTATIRLRWCRYQSYYNDGWHGTWSQDGGVINQQAIHHIDALNWLLGPVKAVCSKATKRLNQLEAEDTMVALLEFSSGALGTIEATTAARPEDLEASLSVVGERGYVHIGGIALNRIDQWKFIDQTKDDEAVSSRFSQEVDSGYGFGHAPLLQLTLDALLAGKIESPVPASQAIPTIELVHSLYRSDELSRWVTTEKSYLSIRLGR